MKKVFGILMGITAMFAVYLGVDMFQAVPKTKNIAVQAIQTTTATSPVFDFDPSQVNNFVIDSVGGVAYVESYSNNGYTINRRNEVPLSLRPYRDSNGVRFQNNAFSHLYRGSSIPHKQLYILYNCLESNASGAYNISNGNPIYANRNASTVGMLLGFKQTKGVYIFGFPTGTTGFITDTLLVNKRILNNSTNANPIHKYRVVSLTFPNSTFQNTFHLGAGSNATALALRPLNGYIKRALFYSEPLSTSEQDSLILALKTQYGF